MFRVSDVRRKQHSQLIEYRTLLKVLSVIIMVLLLIITYRSFIQTKEGVRYCYLDVGQGDCVVIIDNDTVFLIDGGGDRFMNENYNKGKEVILPFLIEEGIKDIDIAFITHNHYDHIKGIIELMSVFKIKEIALSTVYEDDYHSYVKRMDVMKKTVRANANVKENSHGNVNDEQNKNPFEIVLSETDSQSLLDELFLAAMKTGTNIIFINEKTLITSENVSLQCLYPLSDTAKTEHENDNSMVIMSHAQGISSLHTGDIEEDVEAILLSEYSSLLSQTDILKVAHHGSISSSSEVFIDRITPTVAIVLVGENLFGHPHYEVINRFETRKIPLYLTMKCGMIEVLIRDESYEIIPYKGEQP